MASFPTTAKTFTTKNTGDVIQAAHINDQQDEINAIEAGYLQGTARLNSSNSTLANLSVSGGCTLASLTLSSNMTVSGELFVVQSPPFALVRSTSVVQVANNTPTIVSFNVNVQISTASMHSTTSNPTRVVPPSSGVYQITGAVDWTDGSTQGVRLLDLLVSDTTVIFRRNQPGSRNAGTVLTQHALMVYLLQTTDWVELRVFQDSGTTSSLQNQAFSPFLSMVKVR